MKYKCIKWLLCDYDRRGSVIVGTTLAHPIRESQCVSKTVWARRTSFKHEFATRFSHHGITWLELSPAKYATLKPVLSPWYCLLQAWSCCKVLLSRYNATWALPGKTCNFWSQVCPHGAICFKHRVAARFSHHGITWLELSPANYATLKPVLPPSKCCNRDQRPFHDRFPEASKWFSGV